MYDKNSKSGNYYTKTEQQICIDHISCHEPLLKQNEAKIEDDEQRNEIESIQQMNEVEPLQVEIDMANLSDSTNSTSKVDAKKNTNACEHSKKSSSDSCSRVHFSNIIKSYPNKKSSILSSSSRAQCEDLYGLRDVCT